MNNLSNNYITCEDIKKLIYSFTGIDFYVKDVSLFQTAFTHKSYKKSLSGSNNFSCLEDSQCVIVKEYFNFNVNENYERLEFLGDKVIELVVVEYLFDKFNDKDEGFLTSLKVKLVKKEMLSFLCEKLGLEKFILMDYHVLRNNKGNKRFLEDVFESFIGALYLSCDRRIELPKIFLRNVYEKFVDIEELSVNNDNYKDTLMRYFHTKKYSHPVYRVLKNNETFDSKFKKEFHTYVSIKADLLEHLDLQNISSNHRNILNFIRQVLEDEEYYSLSEELIKENLLLVGLGKGTTKKCSEKECAKDALKALGVDKNF